MVHEPAKTAHGRPDFVLVAHGEPIGYVEAEAYGSDLDSLPGEAKTQNERFIQNLGNFLLTNYTEFRLYQGGTLQAQVQLTTPPTQQQVRDLHHLLEAFLGAVPESPATAHDLAHLLPDTYPFAGQSPTTPPEPTRLPKNLALITVRQVAEGIFDHVFVTTHIVESRITLSNKGIGYISPLYLYPNRQLRQKALYGTPYYELNLAPEFLRALSAAVGVPVEALVPEEVFAYIYAVLHSPTYRRRYAEFLRRDFPRVPLPPDGAAYAQLAEAGKRLIALHLLESPTLQAPSVRFPVPGDNSVEKVRYESERLWINAQQYFEPVSPEVWAFRVGGYAVAEKWLSERKGRALSADELLLFPKILTAIEQTLVVMDEVDALTRRAFGWE